MPAPVQQAVGGSQMGQHIIRCLFGSLVVSLTSWAASSFVGPSGRYEVLVIERRDRY